MLTKYRSRESSRNSCSFKERSPTKSITLFFPATSCFLVRWRFSLDWFLPTTQDFMTISSLQNWHIFLNSSLHCIKTKRGILSFKKCFIIFSWRIFFYIYMKCERWGVTHNRWHVTHDAWCSPSKVQLSSSNGLQVMMFWRSGGKGWPTQSINAVSEWVTKVFVEQTLFW